MTRERAIDDVVLVGSIPGGANPEIDEGKRGPGRRSIHCNWRAATQGWANDLPVWEDWQKRCEDHS